MYSPRPRSILKRHDLPSSPSSSSHINNTAANTISNSHYSHYPSPRSYAQNHHNYAPHHALPNHPTGPMPMTSSSSTSTSSKPSSARSCTVHFPPSPALTSTFACHSSTVYDRSPIVVAPNTCALPERGCPGRTYALGGEEDQEEEEADEYDNCVSTSPKKEKRKTKTARDRDFHPRALAFAAAAASSPGPLFGASGVSSSSFSSFGPPSATVSGTSASSSSSSYTSVSLSAAYYNYEHAPVPALVHDLSSESDESDGVSGLPAQIAGYMSALSLNMSVSMSLSPTKTGAMAPAKVQIAGDGSDERDGRKEKAHRRHRSRERVSRHERSSDPDRIPGLPIASLPASSSPIPFSSSPSPATYFTSSSPPFTSASPPSYCPSSSSSSSPSPRKKGVRRSYPTAAGGSLGLGCGGFGAQEEGCLGGF